VGTKGAKAGRRVARTRLIAAAAIAFGVAGVVVALVVFVIRRDGGEPFVESAPPPGLAERFYPPENWAWGELQADGAPVQRYGVAAPKVVSKAAVLILPDYGESAETWFETARDLTAAGITVWVLDGVGQGGSGRLAFRRDLGELRGFDADVAATHAMIDVVIRPEPRRPLIVIGQGVGALVAARAIETGAAADGLILSAPTCGPATPAGALVLVGLGQSRAPGGDAWTRDGPDDFAAHRTHDAWRGAVTHLWQLANPDLRMGGPSLDWEAALGRLEDAARSEQAKILTPTLLLRRDGAADCLSPPGAARQTIAGADAALELEADPQRAVWLGAVEAAVDQAVHRADPTPGAAP
jgi:lysophospholipase